VIDDFIAFCGRHSGLLEQVRGLLFELEHSLPQDSRHQEAVRDLRLQVDQAIEELRAG
jgi:hypothetical protein